MYTVVSWQNETQYKDAFLSLPASLYDPAHLVQNRQEEEQLLLGTHVLSHLFTMEKFLVFEGVKAVARCIVTLYPKDPYAYIGFFECIPQEECAQLLFSSAEDFAKKLGYQKIIGPVNGSFWIGYRLKVDYFDAMPYTSEPYNKPYYLQLFEKNGYTIKDRYLSNRYEKLPLYEGQRKKYKDRYHAFTKKGYEIISVDHKNFSNVMGEIYELIIELYQNFPIFKTIEKNDFLSYFDYFRLILDFSMVKIAYHKKKVVGFVIGVPNYGDLLQRKSSLWRNLQILLKRSISREYILLYMGVHPKHRGLGIALASPIIRNIRLRRARTIGALILEGKVTATYVKEHISSQMNYVLLQKELPTPNVLDGAVEKQQQDIGVRTEKN